MKSTNLHVRKFEEGDRGMLQELYLLCRIQTFYWVDGSSFRLDEFDVDTKDEEILVCEFDGIIAGFIAIWKPDAFIHHLYVDAAYRRKGIGKLLLATAIKTTDQKLTLKCLIKNGNALNFYRTLGWEVIDTGADDLGDYFLMSN
ncbi:GNAT family N-acetyltransferase [Mucilaginibacter angelicae]|uniref:GNAT family N-acetyltransferase n=1 Tax=Mucilaginibacter angelicae TaxID=869718 RepID=A0ABV6LC08_9SPHI